MQPKAAKDTLGRRFYCAFMDYDRCVVRLFGSRRVAERAQITFAGSQESWTLARNRLVPVQQPWIHLGQVPADQPPLQLWPGGLEVQKFEETFLFLLGKKEINNKGISEKPDRRKKKKEFCWVPGRETGSVCASAHQQNSFLSPPVLCSGYYISRKPVVIFGGRYVRRRVAIWVLGL